MNKTILIIDKESNEYQILKQKLELIGFAVHTSSDYQEGFNKIISLKPDLIIYNFHYFLLSEKEYIGKISKPQKYIPIIMVHSSKNEETVIQAYEMGATDYITRPFSPREVEARIKAILRRIDLTKSSLREEIKIGNFIFKPEQYEVVFKTHKVTLSKREQELFLLLIDRKRISRAEILGYLWGYDYYGGCRIVDVNISNLRKKIEENPKKPQYIKTIKGYGYHLDLPFSMGG
jgi:two-component system, OmpR family, alkaline phosphatase synthesis response regulator PhoP